MPQFDVYRNRHDATKARFPLLLDVQSDLLEALHTRMVVPLSPAAAAKSRVLGGLTPTLTIAGKPYLMMTPQLAGIASRALGEGVDNLASERGRIVAALDLLIVGV